MGKSATGKDTVYKELRKRCPGLKTIVPYTTRPIREGETDGVEYYFATNDELELFKNSGKERNCTGSNKSFLCGW